MVDLSNILLNYLMKTYTCGEINIPQDILIEYEFTPLIVHTYEDGTIKVRTHEYNERCVDRW